jgi:Ca2+-dependent lipid-binding protein
LQGKDLAARDLNGLSDPYVRITLLPDKKHRLETKIKRRTLNPKWNETFYFEGNKVEEVMIAFIPCPSYRPEFCIFMSMIMTGWGEIQGV